MCAQVKICGQSNGGQVVFLSMVNQLVNFSNYHFHLENITYEYIHSNEIRNISSAFFTCLKVETSTTNDLEVKFSESVFKIDCSCQILAQPNHVILGLE